MVELRAPGTNLSPIMVASSSLAIALLWMLLAVNTHYRGDWTGLFHIGGGFSPPAEVGGAHSASRDSAGYDGQFYRLIARDPFLSRGYARYVDSPEMRWRRILVPWLAWALALGRNTWVDGAYIAVILGWVFAGSFWAARLACKMGYPAWMGGGFLLLPATLVALDRMTVDIALPALILGVMCDDGDSPTWRLWFLAAGAALSRELGGLLALAVMAHALRMRRHALAAWMASSLIPAAGWAWYVHMNTPRIPEDYLSLIPLAGLLRALAHPLPYPAGLPFREVLMLLDCLALSGAALSVLLMFRYRPDLNRLAGVATWCFLVPVLIVNAASVWGEPFAYGRIMTPFWLLITIQSARRRECLGLLPIILIDLPIGAQFSYYVAAFLRS